MSRALLCALCLFFLSFGCGGPKPNPEDLDGDGIPNNREDLDGDGIFDQPIDTDGDGFPDQGETDPNNPDTDGDGIPDGVEDRNQNGLKDLNETDPRFPDTDKDGLPDGFEDFDRDGNFEPAQGETNPLTADTDEDGLSDSVEKTNGYDPNNADTDGDGLLDGQEDKNGDGLVGTCKTFCSSNEPGDPDSCSDGQSCNLNFGRCEPALNFLCEDSESSPVNDDTDGDGVRDPDEGSRVCIREVDDEFGEQGPGAVNIDINSAGDWQLALGKDAKVFGLSIANTGFGDFNAATYLNYEDPDADVAGFILSMKPEELTDPLDPAAPPLTTAIEANRRIQAKLQLAFQGGGVTVRENGLVAVTWDGFDAHALAQTAVILPAAGGQKTAGGVRDVVLSAIHNRPLSSYDGFPDANGDNIPDPFGDLSTSHVISLGVIRRFDAQNNSVRILVVGAVATSQNFDSNGSAATPQRTRDICEDLANVSAVAQALDETANECDVFLGENTAVADILWVVDRSGSMGPLLDQVAANAVNMFDQANQSGLDFRMGVTTTDFAKNGALCSNAAGAGADRFLGSTPQERVIFEQCFTFIDDGVETGLFQGVKSVTRHLPRADNDQSKIRPDASLELIIVSDERPEEIEGFVCPLPGGFPCQSIIEQDFSDPDPSAAELQQLANLTSPMIQLFKGQGGALLPSNIPNEDATTRVHGIINQIDAASPCGGAERGFGYDEVINAIGGLNLDICLPNIAASLKEIIDDIVARATPVVLGSNPISPSVAVAVNNALVNRSRLLGFIYKFDGNSLVFVGGLLIIGQDNEVFVSYKRFLENSPDPAGPEEPIE